MNKNISIITNFGCRADCWYCIWKGHPYEKIQLKTDWNKLEQFLIDNKSKGKVSVSGGGDCLYKYDKYAEWWIKLLKIINNLNIKLDVHTREKFKTQSFWKNVNRCVFSSDIFDTDKEWFEYITQFTKLRITHVVTHLSTIENTRKYIDFCNKNNCQFTLKELSVYNDNGNYKRWQKLFPNEYFLDNGDYNIYYFPDNTIKEKFI